MSEVFRRRPKSAEGEVIEKTLSYKNRRQLIKSASSAIVLKSESFGLTFIHFTHGFRSLHGSELTYFWNCVKQDGNNSHFSIRREKLARKREPA